LDANNKLDEEAFDRQNNNQTITTTTQLNNNSHRNRILESKFSKRSSTIAFNNTDIGVEYINLIFSSSKQSSNNQYFNEMVQLRKGVKLR
jgi:hypothetical protein